MADYKWFTSTAIMLSVYLISATLSWANLDKRIETQGLKIFYINKNIEQINENSKVTKEDIKEINRKLNLMIELKHSKR